MATFYRGAGIGTYWHTNDARLTGFTPHSPGMTPTCDCLVNHIARATISSPFISLTRSYGVAKDYAFNASRLKPTSAQPAYVYRIEVDDPTLFAATLIDPLVEIAKQLPAPWINPSYHHDGTSSFLLGVIDFVGNKRHLLAQIEQPPGGAGTPRAANLTIELEALVRTLRDAEILAKGVIPKAWIVDRYDVY